MAFILTRNIIWVSILTEIGLYFDGNGSLKSLLFWIELVLYIL